MFSKNVQNPPAVWIENERISFWINWPKSWWTDKNHDVKFGCKFINQMENKCNAYAMHTHLTYSFLFCSFACVLLRFVQCLNDFFLLCVFSIHEFVVSWLVSVASKWIYIAEKRRDRASDMESRNTPMQFERYQRPTKNQTHDMNGLE